jgi:phospholipid/cholesterol/gamma-HCH transport system substrate-binding protein
VTVDEVLGALDKDSRDYLSVLVNAGGQALSDAPGSSGQPVSQDLRESLKRLEPTFGSARRLTVALANRRHNLRRVVHNFQLLATELGQTDQDLVKLVDGSNLTFDAIAAEERRLRQALRALPPTLAQSQTTLHRVGTLAADLGPALQQLRPAARSLAPSLRALRPFLRESKPTIQTELRPFSRDVRPTVRTLRTASADLDQTAPRLTKTLKFANKLTDTLAYNPPGPEEGYLFWAAWANHLGGSIFGLQDAHGPARRGIFLVSCPSLQVLDQLKLTNPSLRTLVELLGAPRTNDVCTPTPTP